LGHVETNRACQLRPPRRAARHYRSPHRHTFELKRPSLAHFAHAPRNEDDRNKILYERPVMTIRPDSDADTAMQYLMWALEYIEKTGDLKAAHHARLALESLRKRTARSTDTGEHAP
jgi:hypothetical protein